MFFSLFLVFLFNLAAFAVEIENSDSPHAIPNSYIVVYKEGIVGIQSEGHETQVESFLKSHGLRGILRRYKVGTFKGYLVEADQAGIDRIASSPVVKKIVQDVEVSIAAPRGA